MFEGLKGMAGIASLMKDLPRMQARMEEVKQALADLRIERTSAGGSVRVVASGTMELLELELAGDAQECLDDLVRVTINDALRAAREEAQRRLAQAAEELGLPMPPGGLSLPGVG